MLKLSLKLTVLFTAIFLTACGAKSKSNNAASALPAATSTTPQALVAAASLSSVAPGGTVTFSVIGGTAPYTWSIQSGGGSMSSTTGASITYTAGSNIGVAFLSVSDSAGNTANASVTIASTTTTTTSGNVCSGYYAATLGTYAASFQFQTSGTTLTGYLSYAGYQYPLVGTCDSNAINFTLTTTNDTFTGSFVANTTSTRSSMQGTYNNVYFGTTQTWTATPQ